MDYDIANKQASDKSPHQQHLNSNQSPQCLDFNQDKICESIVLANGTRVENPSTVKQTTPIQTQTQTQKQTVAPPPEGKCLGMANTANMAHFCSNVLLANGTMIKNPNNPALVTVQVDPRAHYSHPSDNQLYSDELERETRREEMTPVTIMDSMYVTQVGNVMMIDLIV